MPLRKRNPKCQVWTPNLGTWAVLLAGSFGFLDGLGAASASFNVPPGVIPSSLLGVELNHAYVVLDPLSGQLTRASNAVPLEIAP